jgi:hypothetical protein
MYWLAEKSLKPVDGLIGDNGFNDKIAGDKGWCPFLHL